MFFDKLKKANDWLLDILLPKTCLSCRKEGSFVCPECLAKIPIQKSFHCYICAKRSPEGRACQSCKSESGFKLTGLFVASDWQNLLVRQMIYDFKYRFARELANPLGEVLIKYLKTNPLINYQTDKLMLVPVPLHKRRLAWRGFNQAALLAEQIGNYFKIPAANDLIIRSRHTSPQMDIKNKLERIKNIAGAFSLNHNFENSEQIKNKILILVDDVCTTASTLNECALAIKPLKPKEIWGLVVARG